MSLMRQFSGAPLADGESRPTIMPPGLLEATNDVPEDLAPFYIEGMYTLVYFVICIAWKGFSFTYNRSLQCLSARGALA
jgi:hypothetical protein